jgi:hypothetical protein
MLSVARNTTPITTTSSSTTIATSTTSTLIAPLRRYQYFSVLKSEWFEYLSSLDGKAKERWYSAEYWNGNGVRDTSLGMSAGKVTSESAASCTKVCPSLESLTPDTFDFDTFVLPDTILHHHTIPLPLQLQAFGDPLILWYVGAPDALIDCGDPNIPPAQRRLCVLQIASQHKSVKDRFRLVYCLHEARQQFGYDSKEPRVLLPNTIDTYFSLETLLQTGYTSPETTITIGFENPAYITGENLPYLLLGCDSPALVECFCAAAAQAIDTSIGTNTTNSPIDGHCRKYPQAELLQAMLNCSTNTSRNSTNTTNTHNTLLTQEKEEHYWQKLLQEKLFFLFVARLRIESQLFIQNQMRQLSNFQNTLAVTSNTMQLLQQSNAWLFSRMPDLIRVIKNLLVIEKVNQKLANGWYDCTVRSRDQQYASVFAGEGRKNFAFRNLVATYKDTWWNIYDSFSLLLPPTHVLFSNPEALLHFEQEVAQHRVPGVVFLSSVAQANTTAAVNDAAEPTYNLKNPLDVIAASFEMETQQQEPESLQAQPSKRLKVKRTAATTSSDIKFTHSESQTARKRLREATALNST